MVQNITNDEFAEVANHFENSAKMAFDIMRLMYLRKDKFNMKDYLKNYVSNHPFVFSGTLNDLAWFWNNKNSMPYSEFENLDRELCETIKSNFQVLAQQGYIEIDNQSKNIRITRQGKELIYSENFINSALSQQIEQSLTISEIAKEKISHMQEEKLNEQLKNLPTDFTARQNELCSIIKAKLNNTILDLEQGLFKAENTDVPICDFIDKIMNLKNKIPLYMEQQGFPSPTGDLQMLNKLLEKINKDLVVHNKPLEQVLNELRNFLKLKPCNLEVVELYRQAVKKAIETEQFLYNEKSKSEYVKIVTTEKGIQFDYYIENKLTISTQNKTANEYNTTLNSIMDKLKDFNTPNLTSDIKTINFDDNVLSTEQEIAHEAMKKPEAKHKAEKVSTAQTNKTTEKAVAAQIDKTAEKVAEATVGVSTMGAIQVAKIGQELITKGVKAVEERTRS